MGLFKWLFRSQWDCLLEQGRRLDADEVTIRELRTALVASKDACGIWRERAQVAEKPPRPMSKVPRDGTEFWAIIPLRYRNHKLGGNVRDDGFFDIDGDQHGPQIADEWTHIIGWLPTTSGGEGE